MGRIVKRLGRVLLEEGFGDAGVLEARRFFDAAQLDDLAEIISVRPLIFRYNGATYYSNGRFGMIEKELNIAGREVVIIKRPMFNDYELLHKIRGTLYMSWSPHKDGQWLLFDAPIHAVLTFSMPRWLKVPIVHKDGAKRCISGYDTRCILVSPRGGHVDFKQGVRTVFLKSIIVKDVVTKHEAVIEVNAHAHGLYKPLEDISVTIWPTHPEMDNVFGHFQRTYDANYFNSLKNWKERYRYAEHLIMRELLERGFGISKALKRTWEVYKSNLTEEEVEV